VDARVQRLQRAPTPLPTPEEAAEHTFTPFEKELLGSWESPLVVGSPATVRRGLEELVGRTGADELVLVTRVHGIADRLRSYELVAEAFDIAPSAAQA
jgi:alkanesulfonate monooxygenase SsuD/methylene tetrahydromethanopterin reductase-like flavin-dependent oxidoreductase (luciferase family)